MLISCNLEQIIKLLGTSFCLCKIEMMRLLNKMAQMTGFNVGPYVY